MTLAAIFGALSFSSQLTVSAAPSTAIGFVDPETHFGDAGPVTLTITGGIGSKSVSWSHISGGTVSVVDLGNNTYDFTSGSTVTAVYRATVQDAAGKLATTDVTIQIS